MSTPYHPQTNGLVERYNRTLINTLAKMVEKHTDEWDNYVTPALFSYRTSRHSTTRLTPFFLVYGREAKLPTNDTRIEEELSLVHHIEQKIDNLPILRGITQQRVTYEQQKQKDRHDRKLADGTQFQIGYQVLYYYEMLDNKRSSKLKNKWNETNFI